MDRDSNQAWENVALFTLMALQKNTLYRPREIDATWCSLGTSITWYNSNVDNARGRFTRSYQDRVLDVLRFKGFANCGVNGGVVASQHGKISKADYYTIEHGVNDWGQRVKPGVFADYENNASNKTFYANCGEERELADLSIDVALHPNDPGYRRMADEIIKAFDLATCHRGDRDTLKSETMSP